VGRDFDDEVSVQGCTDSFRQRDRRDNPAGFEARKSRLGHISAGCQFDLGQSQSQTAFADRLSDQERAAGFGVSLAVLIAVTALGGEFQWSRRGVSGAACLGVTSRASLRTPSPRRPGRGATTGYPVSSA
jgi:hypothetical protein